MNRSGREKLCPALLLEHRAHPVSEPIAELGAARGVFDEIDAEADLGEGDRADVEQIERLRRDEGNHLRLRLRASQFRQNICIKQPSRQSETSRTGIGSRLRFGSMSRSGEACMAAISASPPRLFRP